MGACIAVGIVLRVNFENHLAGLQAQTKSTRTKNTKTAKIKKKPVKSINTSKSRENEINTPGITGLTQKTLSDHDLKGGEYAMEQSLNVENDLIDHLSFSSGDENNVSIDVNDIALEEPLFTNVQFGELNDDNEEDWFNGK